MVVWKTGVFGAVHWRRCRFRLTFDSPSATRADREARPPSLGTLRPAAAAATTFSFAANRQHQTPQRYLAGHRCITSNRAIGKQGGKRPEHRQAGARSVLWGGARGHVDVDVAVLRLPIPSIRRECEWVRPALLGCGGGLCTRSRHDAGDNLHGGG